jgi:large subunit ribosomal protein L44e
LLVKKRPASELKAGQRRFRRVTAGYRGFPRPQPHTNKPSKRKDIRLECKCGKKHVKTIKRAKRFELIK